MSAFQIASWRAAVIGRWTACILGTPMFLLFLAFFFGEGPPDLSRLTSTERLQFLGMAALFLGLVIAWKLEVGSQESEVQRRRSLNCWSSLV